ncbi:UNVERIFIED_ORG: HNH endonuclease [Bacillus sp. AZ43]
MFDHDDIAALRTAPVVVLPVPRRTPEERASELQRIHRAQGRLFAYRVEMVAGLAHDRSDAGDRPPGSIGAASPEWAHDQGEDRLPGVGEFLPDELALILNCSRAEASELAEDSLTLVHRLPSTLAALSEGVLDWPRARALARELGWPARDTEPAIVAQVEAAVVPRAAELSVSRLRALTRSELMRLDAAAAERRRKDAMRAADVTLRGAGDGMTELRAFLPAPEAAAVLGSVDAEARAAKKAGDPRPIGVLRAMVLSDRVLRRREASGPSVTAALTVIAPLTTLSHPPCDHPGAEPVEPGEVDGQPITADQLRELLGQLDALCPGGLQAPTGGTLDIALVDDDGTLRATVTRPELERLARRGCPDHPGGGCDCPVLDRPPPVDRYRHSPAQERFLRTRDRSCRHPGCRSRAAWADLDHVLPHAEGGATDCANLCCLCRRHNRLKTHARGWRFAMTADGILSVTTPSGVTRTTRPPGTAPPPGVASPTRPPGDDPPPF